MPKFESGAVWSPARYKLIGWRKDKEEVVVRIECWLELVADQMPELRNAATGILQQIRL